MAGSNSKPVVCTFLNLALGLVLIWIVFLYCYHHNSLHAAEDAVNKLRSNNLGDIISKVQSLSQEELAALKAVVHGETHATPSASSSPKQKTIPKEILVKQELSYPLKAHGKMEEEEKFHVGFSTDCTFFQDWQTLLIFHSAVMVRQKGKITRIASGCSDEKKAELTTLYNKLYPQYSVHFTPDFKTDGKTKKKYEFYNKPYGVHHWLSNAEPPIPSGTVVSIIDPDMIFIRPMTAQIRGNPANIYMRKFNPEKEVVPARVQHGTASGQLYGLGAPWAQAYHKHFNRTEICGEGSPCLKTQQGYGEQHFSVGPPYMLERDDWIKLVGAWTNFVPRVYTKYPSLLAEMYAYSMAAAHTELPHFTLMNLMVSNVHAGDEGWKYIDSLGDDVCVPPVDGVFYPGKLMPTVLHYCQFYRAGEYGFQKRRIKKQIFDCDHPMMAELPRDIGKIDYKNRDGEIIKLGKTEARRNAFMLCTVHNAINAMVTHYKSVMCGPGVTVNHNKTINVVEKGYY